MRALPPGDLRRRRGDGNGADRRRVRLRLSTERIAAIIASPDRSAADRTNDIRRKPAEMLAFIGIVPGMIAVDLSSGGGYTTELLARAVGPAGRVYGQSPPRNAPPPPPAAPEGAAFPAAQTPPPAARRPPRHR